MASILVTGILDAFATLDGGIHPGFRPVHAKGFMYSGTFTPSQGAKKLTRAPHANRPSTPVTVRFSGTTGVPTGSDTDPMGASPQGIAIRFHLADHVHTDIIGHSINAFPARTGEEFLEFLRAVIASGPGSAAPPPIVAFRVLVQLAEPGDDVTDSTSIWPETRTEVVFGILTIKEPVDELAPERRKTIFDPLPRVDGIDSAGDPITALRSDIYLVSGRRRRAAAAQ